MTGSPVGERAAACRRLALGVDGDRERPGGVAAEREAVLGPARPVARLVEREDDGIEPLVEQGDARAPRASRRR